MEETSTTLRLFRPPRISPTAPAHFRAHLLSRIHFTAPRFAALLLALSLAWLTAMAAPAWSQDFGGTNGEDPAQDIFIDGIGFAKLVLAMRVSQDVAALPTFKRLAVVLEKNLCWSGFFNLLGGKSRYCRPRVEPGRVDMRLELEAFEQMLLLRLIEGFQFQTPPHPRGDRG